MGRVARHGRIDLRQSVADNCRRPSVPVGAKLRPVRTTNGNTQTSPALSHFRRCFDPEHRKPGGDHAADPLNESKTRSGNLWIILDNEA